jgi:hypothetical protein
MGRDPRHRCGIARSRPGGLDASTAADVVSSLNGHEVFLNLVDHCGWSTHRYAEWLGNALVDLLLVGERGD